MSLPELLAIISVICELGVTDVEVTTDLLTMNESNCKKIELVSAEFFSVFYTFDSEYIIRLLELNV